MILLYAPKITSRITYIVKQLFTRILGAEVDFTHNKTNYREYLGPKINYSRDELDGITIFPHSLLFEYGIGPLSIESGRYNDLPVLFPVPSSPLPFDPFAASFFMLSRYEEYGTQSVDNHGRSLLSTSVAYKNKFLNIPVVDHWALILKKLVLESYPGYIFPEKQYKFIPTLDIDIAYAYKYRSLTRIAGATAKAVLKNDWEDNKRRFRTLFFNQHDPYDTFGLFEDWHSQHMLKPVYFFLLGHYGKYDKNISPHKEKIKHLIRDIHKKHSIGIHPSYRSNKDMHLVEKEIKTLTNIINRPITRSRQHFLMLKFPDTYKNLIKCGITEDYTMGYASRPGFRAGTCTPFLFYDLSTESETQLMVYPFQVMDGTLNQYMKLSPLEAVEIINQLIDEVKKVNGTFISLWHNESLSDIREWHRWREVYQQLLSYGSPY